MNTLFFDVETQRTFDEVGGRQNIQKLGLAAAVTYSTTAGAFCHYTEADVAGLLAEIEAADLVVGFNVLSFDYEVLRAYGPLSPPQTVDMLDHIYRRLGFTADDTLPHPQGLSLPLVPARDAAAGLIPKRASMSERLSSPAK